MDKTLVGGDDLPEKKNIKYIEYYEDGTVKRVEYYKDTTPCYHYCNCNCNCWKTKPYYEQVPWVTHTSDSITITSGSSGSSYTVNSTWDKRLGEYYD